MPGDTYRNGRPLLRPGRREQVTESRCPSSSALTCNNVVELRGIEPRTSSMRTKITWCSEEAQTGSDLGICLTSVNVRSGK